MSSNIIDLTLKKSKVLLFCLAFVAASFTNAGLAKAAPTLANSSMPEATVGQAYSFQLQGTGGTSPYIFEKWYSSYPGSEMILTSSGLFSGTPQAPGIWTLGIRTSDSTGLGTYSTLTFKVNAAGGGSTTGIVGISHVTPADGQLVAGSNMTIGWTTVNLSTSVPTIVSLQIIEGTVMREVVRITSSVLSVNGTTNSINWTVPANLAVGDYKFLVQLDQIFPDSNGNGTFPKAESFGILTVGSVTTAPTLNISLNSVSAAGTAPQGLPNFPFASFKFQATGGSVSITSLQIVSDSTNVASNISSIQAYKDNSLSLGGVSSLNLTEGSLRFTNLVFATPLNIPSGATATLDLSANISGTAAGSARLGIRGLQVTPGNTVVSGSLPLYGNALTITGSGGGTGSLQITSPSTLPDGLVGTAYSYTFAALGGTALYTWSMPPTNVNAYPCCYLGFNTSTAVLASVPASGGLTVMPFSGVYQFAVRVTDSAGASVDKVVSYTIKPEAVVGQNINEGYIDFLTSGAVSGWVFRSKSNDLKVLPSILITFESASNSQQVYTLNITPSIPRPDVNVYLRERYGINQVNVSTGFLGNPQSVLPSGTFRIKSAQYDGINFVLSDNAKQPITINQNDRPQGSGYVKVTDDPTVYWVSSWGGKMPMVTEKVFLSYGSQWSDVRIISQEELDTYEDIFYIKLANNARVYKLENGVKRYILPAAATRLNIDPASVVTVNNTEFYTYRTGSSVR